MSSIYVLQLWKGAFYKVYWNVLFLQEMWKSTQSQMYVSVKPIFSNNLFLNSYFNLEGPCQQDDVDIFRMTSVALDTIVKVALPVVALVGK